MKPFDETEDITAIDNPDEIGDTITFTVRYDPSPDDLPPEIVAAFLGVNEEAPAHETPHQPDSPESHQQRGL